MHWPAEPQNLARIGTDHPALWGDLQVCNPEPPLILDDAVVLPAWKNRDARYWWTLHSLGIYNREGQHVDSLSDRRGNRRICFPPPTLALARFNRARARTKPLVLYGGTLYDHFGHLLMDMGRAYQLLRLFRNTKLQIWFHDCTPHRGSVLRLPFVQQWLACLGIAKRVRIVRRPLLAQQLISGPALYSDRQFVSRDLRPACQMALKPQLRRQLEQVDPPRRRLAYLSRHRLSSGSTHFAGEAELVAQLEKMAHVDVICPEELGFEEKIALYRRYDVVAGFPQSCMNLKLFAPGDHLARQVMFIAGPKSLSSSWVNIDRATGFGDQVVDCSGPAGEPEHLADPDPQGQAGEHNGSGQESRGFQRTNPIDIQAVLAAIRALAG